MGVWLFVRGQGWGCVGPCVCVRVRDASKRHVRASTRARAGARVSVRRWDDTHPRVDDDRHASRKCRVQRGRPEDNRGKQPRQCCVFGAVDVFILGLEAHRLHHPPVPCTHTGAGARYTRATHCPEHARLFCLSTPSPCFVAILLLLRHATLTRGGISSLVGSSSRVEILCQIRRATW